MPNLDEAMMARAISAGKAGDPSPNPHVGSLVCRGEEVLAQACHQHSGNEHAEVAALREAGEAARGATLYVTLEPCNHHGKTPPCVDAILSAGIARVVIGCRDPNPHVQGGGIERLTAAGVEVKVGVLEAECQKLIVPWAKYITKGTTFLAVKLAVSVDGRTATRTGESNWITCIESRARVHALRSFHDAVMVGINTVLQDNPRLTVREVSGRNPVRIIVDSSLRLPMTAAVVETAHEAPTCVVTTNRASPAVAAALEARGLSVIMVPATAEGRCDMRIVLKELAAREIVSALCEGGAELTGSLVAGQLADELHLFIAPVLLGPRGRPGAVDWAGPASPAEAPRVDPPSWQLCGTDAYLSGPLVYPNKPQ
jgi:diaminohydroxyphosphoribosylaminopyrimidine deaminase/5-amino-6-(5-phosphoribosylamino)uracil reductase